jgi:hypothetical protein
MRRHVRRVLDRRSTLKPGSARPDGRRARGRPDSTIEILNNLPVSESDAVTASTDQRDLLRDLCNLSLWIYASRQSLLSCTSYECRINR